MKIIDKKEVGSLIKDNDTILISGSGGSGSPETLLKSIHDSFIKTNHPKNITVSSGISPGNLTTNEVGMNLLTPNGLVGKSICAHMGMGKSFGKAIGENQFPAFAIPLGVIGHLYRAIASKEVGVITHIGLNTFVDPRLEGACANEKAKSLDPMVELINIDGKENLLYKSFPVDVALLKATYADADGNISLEEEAVIGEQYNMAIASHNSGGIVIVEVKEIKPKNSLKAKNVLIHSSLVDYVVISDDNHSLGEYNIPTYRPELTGDKKIKLNQLEKKELDERKICARRAFFEINKGNVINLGVGIPEVVANVCAEEGISDDVYLSVETGSTGGVPMGGVTFGATINADCIISTPEQFDAYNGGVLDMGIIGLAEVDKEGNVNVSKFGKRITGPGGFINITQSTKKVLFVGTFTTLGLEEEIKDGKLVINKEGEKKKFVNKVEQVTFSAKQAIKNNQEVLYITERCVFRLTEEGLVLEEIAEDIDLEKDILSNMEFKPIISPNLKTMDKKIFIDKLMNI